MHLSHPLGLCVVLPANTIDPMLVECWPAVSDFGPPFIQHWVNTSGLLWWGYLRHLVPLHASVVIAALLNKRVWKHMLGIYAVGFCLRFTKIVASVH